jgi:type II secretory pathway component PulC
MKHEAWIELLELTLVAALGIGLAHVTWLAIAPRTAGAPSAVTQSVQPQPGALAARQIFGAPSGEPSAKRVNSASGLVLLGVLSSPEPGAGRAILGMKGSRPVLVTPGEPIADGVVLQEVHADHVIVLRQGAAERIDLERGASRPSAPSAPLQAPAPMQAPARK